MKNVKVLYVERRTCKKEKNFWGQETKGNHRTYVFKTEILNAQSWFVNTNDLIKKTQVNMRAT